MFPDLGGKARAELGRKAEVAAGCLSWEDAAPSRRAGSLCGKNTEHVLRAGIEPAT